MKIFALALIASAFALMIEGNPWRPQPGIARDGDGHTPWLHIKETPTSKITGTSSSITYSNPIGTVAIPGYVTTTSTAVAPR